MLCAKEDIFLIAQFEGAGGPVDHIRADLSGSEDGQDDSDGIRRVRVLKHPSLFHVRRKRIR